MVRTCKKKKKTKKQTNKQTKMHSIVAMAALGYEKKFCFVFFDYLL